MATAPTARVDNRADAHRNRRRLLLIQLLGDILFAYIGLSIGFLLRFWLLRDFGRESSGTQNFFEYQPVIVLGVITLVLSYFYVNVYDWKLILRPRRMAPTFVRATILWAICYLAISVILRTDPEISRLFMFYSMGAVLATVGLWKWIYARYATLSRVSSQLTQRILFVGWTPETAEIASAIYGDPEQPFEIIGVVRGSAPAEEDRQRETFRTDFHRPLGDLDQLEQILRNHHPDILVVADLDLSREQMVRIATLCEIHYVQLKIVPSMFQIFLSGLRLETISGRPLLGVEELRINHLFNHILKRLTDLAGALFGLLLSAPVIALFAFLIKRESPGPVFYRQVRSGLNGQPFTIYKLRSMRLDAEADSGARWAVEDDPRRLRIGAFMRKWNIDELPQFWNILKGDMSLVGPRPERPELIQNFQHDIRHYNQRHVVRPGLTGWAQVNGYRGNTSLEERIRYDIYYIENWSFFWDFWIMLLTFFKRDNAY